jgi:hypothetical protein
LAPASVDNPTPLDPVLPEAPDPTPEPDPVDAPLFAKPVEALPLVEPLAFDWDPELLADPLEPLLLWPLFALEPELAGLHAKAAETTNPNQPKCK